MLQEKGSISYLKILSLLKTFMTTRELHMLFLKFDLIQFFFGFYEILIILEISWCL